MVSWQGDAWAWHSAPELVQPGWSPEPWLSEHSYGTLLHGIQTGGKEGRGVNCQPLHYKLTFNTITNIRPQIHKLLFLTVILFFFSGIPLIFIKNYTCVFHLRKKRLWLEVHDSFPFLVAENKLINAVTIQNTILIPYWYQLYSNNEFQSAADVNSTWSLFDPR